MLIKIKVKKWMLVIVVKSIIIINRNNNWKGKVFLRNSFNKKGMIVKFFFLVDKVI